MASRDLVNPYWDLPDPYWADVIFYLSMDAPGDAPRDISLANKTVTELGPDMDFQAGAGPLPGMSAWYFREGNTPISATKQLQVNLTGESLTGDYTFELWARQSARSGNYNVLTHWDGRGFGTESTGDIQRPLWAIFPGNPAGAPAGSEGASLGESPVPGAWFHVCLERQSGVVRAYYNGQPSTIQLASDVDTVNGTLYLGGKAGLTGGGTWNDWSGWLGPVRVTKNRARYGGVPFIPGFDRYGRMTARTPSYSVKKWARVGWTALNASPAIRVAEIELRETAGGTSVNTTKTSLPTYSSTSGTAANAFNWDYDKLNTACTLTAPGTITVDLKESFAVRHLRLMQGSSVTPNYASSFILKGSHNGTDWTNLLTVTGETGWTRFSARAYHVENETAYRYYQFEATAFTPSTTGEIMQISLAESPSGPNLAQNSRNYGTSYDGNNNRPKSGAFDGVTGSGSQAWVYGLHGWAGVRLLTPVSSVDEIKIWSVAGEQVYTPNAGYVETSQDGQRWQREWSWTGTTFVSGEAKVITKP